MDDIVGPDCLNKKNLYASHTFNNERCLQAQLKSDEIKDEL